MTETKTPKEPPLRKWETKTTQEIFDGFNKYPVDFSFDERWVLEADVLRERMELKRQLQELLKSIPKLNNYLHEANLREFQNYANKVVRWFDRFEDVVAVLGKETNK